jgi:hypothetical protein
MTRWKAGLTFLAAATLIYSAGALIAPPWASAHTAQAGFSPATCFESGAWGATLTITATNLELDPQATITVNGQPPMNPVAVPYTHQYTAMAGDATLTASAHIVWTDGFTQNVGPFVAHRPDGCTPPTTQPGTTTTTTCAMAIPPRGDCEGATTSTPTSSPVPSSTPTTSGDVATTVPGPVAPTTVATISKPPQPLTPTTRSTIALPSTGASDTLKILAVIGGFLVIFGAIALTAKRDRRLQDRT